MSEITNILIYNNFTAKQLKLLIAILGKTPKSTIELANYLEITTKKLLLDLKKIEHDDIEIIINEDSIFIEIGIKKFNLSHIKTSKSTKSLTKADEKEDSARRVFEFWLSVMLNPNGKIKKTNFSTYRGVILGALRNYEESELILAILGCSKSLWNMGYDDKGSPTNKRYDSLDLILRATKIEGFISRADQLSIEEQLSAILGKTQGAESSRDLWAANRNNLIG